MRKLLLSFYFACCILHFSFSQNPLVKQWDYRFGGTDDDELFSFQQTSDKGYILGGYSASGISGDKTQNSWGDWDYWMVKTDSSGNKLWDKRFGGIAADFLYSLQQTDDRGYLLGGFSRSGISGDKTQSNQDTICSFGCKPDYWIVKTDSSGNKLWDKRFGGTDYDNLNSHKQTADGGYILGGDSRSGIGGDKTQASWGQSDYWIVKTDSSGNKLWDKRFGGTDNDFLNSLQQTTDGGYILGGYSQSDISGDKSQPNRDTVCTPFCSADYWIIKIDSLGNKLWEKVFGGMSEDELFSLQQTTDGGYILAGVSTSGIGGDKTQASKGGWDYWIVKTDSMGNKLWDKDFGGTSVEYPFGNISQTNDGGYLIAGSSYSPISGDKTENNLGTAQTWIIKIDSMGIKQWDKTLFTNSGADDDEKGLAIQTNNGCYVFANFTGAGIGGYKTQDNWDTICFPYCTFDYWFIKFCDTTSTTSITQLPDYPNTFSIYPNPANDYIIINYHFKAGDEIRLTDVLGKLLFTTKIKTPSSDFRLPTSDLSPGIYFLKAGNEVKKFVKE